MGNGGSPTQTGDPVRIFIDIVMEAGETRGHIVHDWEAQQTGKPSDTGKSKLSNDGT